MRVRAEFEWEDHGIWLKIPGLPLMMFDFQQGRFSFLLSETEPGMPPSWTCDEDSVVQRELLCFLQFMKRPQDKLLSPSLTSVLWTEREGNTEIK